MLEGLSVFTILLMKYSPTVQLQPENIILEKCLSLFSVLLPLHNIPFWHSKQSSSIDKHCYLFTNGLQRHSVKLLRSFSGDFFLSDIFHQKKCFVSLIHFEEEILLQACWCRARDEKLFVYRDSDRKIHFLDYKHEQFAPIEEARNVAHKQHMVQSSSMFAFSSIFPPFFSCSI